jgi:hypothetical protein
MCSTGVQRGQQVEAGDAAARSAAPPLGVEPDQHRRHAMALREPRRSDPHHPRMPAGAGEHQRGRVEQVLGEIGPRRRRGVHHLALGDTALAVRAVQLSRDRVCARLVGGQHELHTGIRAVEPTRRVDAGTEPERQIALIEPLHRHLGGCAQRADAEPPAASRDCEPLPNQRPVFTPEGHKVRDRRERHEVEVRLGRLHPQKRRRQLVGDAGGAQLAKGITTQPGMKDGAAGQLSDRLVMVGDDHVDSGFARRRHLSRARDAAIGRDEEPRPPRGEALDSLPCQPVSVLEAPGDVPVAGCASLAQRPDQDRRRRDPVAVVVTVDRDRVPGGDRPLDDRGDLAHGAECEWVVRIRCLQERPCLPHAPVAATHEGHGDRFGQVQPLHECPGLGVGEGLEREGSSGGSLGGHVARLRTPLDGTVSSGRAVQNPRSARKLHRSAEAWLFDAGQSLPADADRVDDRHPD